jgi:DNA repair photolyase
MVAPEYREEPCKTALNPVKGMPFAWSLNPYMGCVHRCTYCYVRAFEKRADRPAGDLYGRSIRVKTNVADVLRYELQRRSWRRQSIAIGAATDPYQPAEGRYKLTRSCLEVLVAAHNPFGLITRGPMIVRDIDVLQEASRRAEVSVNVSIPTLDDEVWRKTEPGTAPPRQRFRAVRALSDAGIKVCVAMAPLLPGISDAPAQVEEIIKAAREAGAVNVWANLLHLRAGTREHFLGHLARDWPELLQTYRLLYARDAYLSDEAKAPALSLVAELKQRYGISDYRRWPVEPPQQPRQLSLLAAGGAMTAMATA